MRLLFRSLVNSNSGFTPGRRLSPFGPAQRPVVADTRWAASPRGVLEVPGRGCLMAAFHARARFFFVTDRRNFDLSAPELNHFFSVLYAICICHRHLQPHCDSVMPASPQYGNRWGGTASTCKFSGAWLIYLRSIWPGGGAVPGCSDSTSTSRLGSA